MSRPTTLTVHTDADIRDDSYNLTVTLQGTQLDIITLIDQLEWAVSDDPNARVLALLRDSIAGTVGLVETSPTNPSPRTEDQREESAT